MSELAHAVSFDESETRTDEMHRTIDQWLTDLSALTDEARASERFQGGIPLPFRVSRRSR